MYKEKVMSQRTENVNEEFVINLQVKVSIDSFSNHNGFGIGQIDSAIEEFKDEISNELLSKLVDEFQMQEFLQSVDFVSYEVTKNRP
jgi:hypothetical protein